METDSREDLDPDDPGPDPILVYLQDADRRCFVAAQVTGDLQPAPFEPSRLLLETQFCGGRVPLVHAARIEQERSVDLSHMGAVGVAVDDDVGLRKPPPEAARQSGVRTEVAQAQRPQQRLRLFDPPGPVAVDDDDPPARHRHLTSRGQRVQSAIVVAAHCLDGSQTTQLVQRGGGVDVAGVEDDLNTFQDLEKPVRQPLEKLRAVRVRHDADKGRHAARVAAGDGRKVRRTASGAMLNTAAIPKTKTCPEPNATPPITGPMTPPM